MTSQSEPNEHEEHGEHGEHGAEAVDEPRDGGRAHIVFLLLAFATVIAILIAVVTTRAWDGYVCDTDEDCRGIKVCRESRCISPEIWQRQQLESAPTTE